MTSPPSGCQRDFHPRAVEHARHTKESLRPEPEAWGLLSDETGLLMAAVVPVVMNLARHAILLPIDLRLLLRRQLAAVGGAVVAHFLVDLRFVRFQVCGFAGGQLSALDALRDAVLLVLGALADFTLRIRVLHRGVVLVLINLLGKLVLLLI